MRWAHSTFSDISIYKAQNLRITPSIAFYIRPKNTPTHTASSERKAERRKGEKNRALLSLPFLAAQSLVRQRKSKIQFCIFMPTAVHWIWLGGTASAAIYDSSQVAHAARLPHTTAPALWLAKARQALEANGIVSGWHRNRVHFKWAPNSLRIYFPSST